MNKLGKIKLDNINLKNQIKGLTSNITISADKNTILKPNSLGNISVEESYKINPTTIPEISLVDDKILKGGFRVVSTIQDRDNILCCYRKTGMKVIVVGPDFSFTEYILKSEDPCENNWEEDISNAEVDETEVLLVNDYSDLANEIETQAELNTVLKTILLQLRSDLPTKTSDLTNDGEDGINPFITTLDIPDVVPQVNADWNSNSGVSRILNKPTNLSNFNNDEGFITIDDLPTIPIQVNSDWESNSGVSEILNKPTNLSEFNNDQGFITADDIPDVTPQVNSDWNAISGVEEILNKPTNVSEFDNDAGYITIDDIPPIPEQTNADWNSTSGPSQILNKPNLHQVATSGDYNDLDNKPNIPVPVDISGKEDKANKQNNLTTDGTGIKYPTVDAVNGGLVSKLNNPTTDGSWVVTKSGSTITYTDASTFGQNISNSNLTWSADRTQNLNAKKLSFTGGRVSVPALELEITAENSVPNKIWTDGVGYYFNNNLGIKKKVAIGSVFTYTPTGNFTISAIKTALEATGMIFNDCHIIIILGSNNYTCSIDIGASNLNTIITIGKRGSGSISFTSTRTLNSGVDTITIINGNEGSMAKLEFGTTTDFLTIRNL